MILFLDFTAMERGQLVQLVWCSSRVAMPHRSGERAPGRRLGNVPQDRGGKAPTSAVRNAAPWPPCGWACPFSGRERPIHDADRRAYRRFAAAFFLRPRDRLLETDRGAHTVRP